MYCPLRRCLPLLLGVGLGVSSFVSTVQAQDAPPAAAEAAAEPSDPRLASANRLTGACLVLQAEQRLVREAIRDRAAELNGWFMALNEAAEHLAEPVPDPASAAQAREEMEQLNEEREQIDRWLWGEEAPGEPGLTRTALHERIATLRRQRRIAELMLRVHTLEDPFEREHLRGQLQGQAQGVRERIDTETQPLRDRLSLLDEQAAEQGEGFERVMTGFGRSVAQGPVPVEAVRADAWFQHGLISYRWSDRRGRLVATAQVRLQPQPDPEPAPPLLLERFPILGQTPQEVTLSVGYFSIIFRVTVEEAQGEQNVLDAATRLLDLEGLGAVNPSRRSAAQN